MGGGGSHRHVIYVPSVKNQYKRVVFGYISGVGRCQKVGAHRYVIYVPSVKNQYKRVILGYLVI